MLRTRTRVLAPLLTSILAFAPTAWGQDELVPEEETDEGITSADEVATDTYTFEDSGLALFDHSRLDGVIPGGLGITGENLAAGTWAMRVRFSRQSFDGLRDSRSNVSSADAFAAGYTVAPTSQTTDRAEFEFVHGFDERWTVWGMVPFVKKELDADIMGGGSSTSENSGLGDVRVGANYLLHEDEQQRFSISMGLGLPTGEFDGRDTYGGVADALLPYSMQLGTGTLDFYPSADWTNLLDGWAMGARVWGRFPIGENSDDWAVSREFDADFWSSRQLSDSLSASLRLNLQWWGDVHGGATELDPGNSPLEDAGLQAGSRLNLFGGVAWDLEPRTAAGANRLELEIGAPLDERLDGPALSQEWMLRFGWKLSL